MESYCSAFDLSLRKEAIISHIEGDAFKRCRLSELGFVPGTSLRLIAKMPFKGPYVFSLRGGRIALRAQDAKLIFVYQDKD